MLETEPGFSLFISLDRQGWAKNTHTHTHIYLYIYWEGSELLWWTYLHRTMPFLRVSLNGPVTLSSITPLIQVARPASNAGSYFASIWIVQVGEWDREGWRSDFSWSLKQILLYSYQANQSIKLSINLSIVPSCDVQQDRHVHHQDRDELPPCLLSISFWSRWGENGENGRCALVLCVAH